MDSNESNDVAAMGAQQEQLSVEQAVELLNSMSPEQIDNLRMLQKRQMSPWAGKHHSARTARAIARISKRKNKR